MRLARFNCIATYGQEVSGHFKGFPIPAAAGLISALTLFVLWVSDTGKDLNRLKIVFLILMLFLSFLMVSSIRYPSFKKVTWNTQKSLGWVVVAFILLLLTIIYHEWLPALLMVIYAVYGLVRPFIGNKLRKEIEEEILSPEDEENDNNESVGISDA